MSEEGKGKKPGKLDHGPQGTQVFSREEVNKLIDDAAASKTAVSARAQLKGVSLEVSGREFPLDGARHVIGRAGSCDIILTDSSVSSEHARINHDADGWRVVNLLSTNGTFVNGKRVSNEVLHHGDRVRFGRVEFLFQDPDKQKSGSSATGRTGRSTPAWMPWAVFGGIGVAVLVIVLVLLR